MQGSAREAGRHTIGAAVVGWMVLYAAGCGTADSFLIPVDDSATKTIGTQSCAAAPAPDEADTLVVLVWDGGMSDQVRARALSPFDALALDFVDAEPVVGDLDGLFREAVLARVRAILCSLDPMDVAVVEGAADEYADATIVHICGDEPFAGGKHIGQADFDPCNEHADDSVVIWGGALATRIGGATFGEWVNAFANTTAHEIGHTLGFAHPNEETLASLLPVPGAEVMRSKVTVSQLLGEQNFLLEQETCPGAAPGEGSYRLLSVDD